MKANKIARANERYAPTASLQDENGKPLEWEFKQISLKAKRAGLFWRTGSSGSVVGWWQRRCNEILGHSQTVDGLYGKTARNETIALQKQLNLAQDGVAGYNSIQAAFYN